MPGRVVVDWVVVGWVALPEFVSEGACAPGVLGRVVVGWAPLPESVPEGACAAGVFAGAGLDDVPLDCAETPEASASANPDRTASLIPMRSVALMTSPPPRWVSAQTRPASLDLLDASICSFGNNGKRDFCQRRAAAQASCSESPAPLLKNRPSAVFFELRTSGL